MHILHKWSEWSDVKPTAEQGTLYQDRYCLKCNKTEINKFSLVIKNVWQGY